jgi:hypothetical protein
VEHRHFRLVFLPALLAMAAGSAATARMTATPAQQVATPTAPATGVITGTVVDGDSGAPIGGAVVQLNTRVAIGAGRGGAVNDQLMTTPDGRFLLRGLPKGPYVLTVRKPGYMNGVPGRRSPRSTSTQAIELTDGQRITNLSISMWKYASIIGTIVDETGEPFVGATVKACLRVEQAGRMKFDFVNPDASAITDDRGVFRQNNLLPGDYVIVVASASATMPASVQDLYNQALRDGRETELNREINATTCRRSQGCALATVSWGSAAPPWAAKAPFVARDLVSFPRLAARF